MQQQPYGTNVARQYCGQHVHGLRERREPVACGGGDGGGDGGSDGDDDEDDGGGDEEEVVEVEKGVLVALQWWS
jgi:hypothetical protein